MEKLRLAVAMVLTAGWVLIAGWCMGTLARLPGSLPGQKAAVVQKAPEVKPAKVATVPLAAPHAPN